MLHKDNTSDADDNNNHNKIKQLEKSVRILQKRLERSEADRKVLEKASEIKELLLKSVIRELEESQALSEKRGQELETALQNLKALQMKLIESEKMSALGVLVAGIAHEINNPVNFIYGNLYYANNYFKSILNLINLYEYYYPEPVAEIQQEIETIELDFIKQDLQSLFESMNTGAERIFEIVKSLRIFSRLDEADFKTADIHLGIDSTLSILNHRLKPSANVTQGIQVIRNFGTLPAMECYPGQLNQVFLNIIVNAIDALEDAVIKNPQLLPTISITTELVNEQAVIRIADNGLGISEKAQSQLFTPFFTTKDIGKGTGLGLSISYQIIVELHAGILEYYSKPGSGAEFVIIIPVQQTKR
ncbi:PAS/PAC sensor signal transduction histidine kinase [Calothrix sp. NIES-4071]|nr:PAS/PAC sensor signal transduction histidine kinase [Calothrix sp. NIES-4071]BAZ62804.1 PAS/PAC sensor signal transduction histidine kinase [Calothrix sp. NIES-4105]